MHDFLTAITLLTTVRFRLPEGAISGRAFAYYPAIGLLIGAGLAGWSWLCRLVFPFAVAGALTVLAWVVITGALHLDGFADACDALIATTSRERRLEILRDVHLGTFGVTGLALLLILKVATVSSTLTFAPLVLAPVLGRWAMVYAATYPTARNEGMAVLFRAGLGRMQILIATISAGIVAAAFGWLGWATFVGAFLITLLLCRTALARLGGLTGDIYGLICESVELTTLLISVGMHA